MSKTINHKLSTLLNKNLRGKRGVIAVIGWFSEDDEAIVPFGNFGSHAPERTSFQIGSVTKLFTAILAGIFANDHKLELQGKVGHYLELDSSSTVSNVVIEDTLTHHSGLPSAPKDLLGKYDHNNPYQHVSRERLMDYLNTYNKPINANHRFQYSNLGFSIVGLVLEAITGKTYQSLVSDEICQPLGIEDLWITQPKDNIYLSPGAMKRKKETPRWALNAIAPAGGIDAHILDMLKFAKANLPGHPFYPRCEIAHQARRTISKRMAVGLGWLITNHKGIGKLHSHNGATGGFNSFLGIHPAGRFGVVVLTNFRLTPFQELGLAMDPATVIGFEGLKFMAKKRHHA